MANPITTPSDRLRAIYLLNLLGVPAEGHNITIVAATLPLIREVPEFAGLENSKWKASAH